MVSVVKSYKASDSKLYGKLEDVIKHEIWLIFEREGKAGSYENFINERDIKFIFNKREELKNLFEVYEKMLKAEKAQEQLARESLHSGPSVSCDASWSSSVKEFE